MRIAPISTSPLLLLLFAAAAHASAPADFQYQRRVTASATGQSCAVLPPAVFPHAAPGLRDLRLFSDADRRLIQLPYLLTISSAQQADTDPAALLNLHRTGSTVDFDLSMPPRPYTEVLLDLPASNFIASAEVTGLENTAGAHPVPLGQFTLFDLTSQHLSRDTTLPLQESTFPRLHIRLHFHALPGSHAATASPFGPDLVRGAAVPPSREAQVLFETAMATTPSQIGRTTVARFALPQHLPIERILFRLSPGHTADFLRTVHIVARPDGSDITENATGTIAYLHRTLAGLDLREQQLAVDATIGANLQGPAELTVSIDNGAAPPLAITSVALQIRQSRLCFAPTGDPLTLAYGNPDLRTPQNSAAQILASATPATTATIGPESSNPQWRAQPDVPKQQRRHPHRIWIVLLGLAVLVGITAVRASRTVRGEL